MFGIGPMELVLILVVALLVLGPKRMPDLARTLGRSLGELRRASHDLRQSLALDDLQNDLRKGLKGEGTIQKPSEDEDRPAQAGDDLAPGNEPPAAGASAPSVDGEEGDADAAETTPQAHPGELPLDQDPHAHHEANDAVEPKAKMTPADSALGSVPVGTGAPARPAQPESADSTGNTGSKHSTDKERG